MAAALAGWVHPLVASILMPLSSLVTVAIVAGQFGPQFLRAREKPAQDTAGRA